MDKNKIIILALIVIIVALLVGIAATTMPNVNKKDTNVTYKGKSKITEGDTINLKLTAVNGTPLANQNVNVTITNKDKASSYYSVVTNAKGIGKLKSDKSAGNYTVFINYGGNEIYNACNFTKKIVIEEKVVEATVEHANSQDSAGQTNDDYMSEREKIYAARQKAADDGIPMAEYIHSPELVEKYQAMVED